MTQPSPRAHGDADIGGRERRCVIDAVTDHHHRAIRPLGNDDLHFRLRRQFPGSPVHSELSRHRGDDIVAVARGKHDAAYAGIAEGRKDRLGIRANFVGERDDAGDNAVDRHGDDGGSLRQTVAQGVRIALPAAFAHIAAAANHDGSAVDRPFDAGSGHLRHMRRRRQRQGTLAGSVDQRLRYDMVRGLVERGRQPQHVVGREPGGGPDLGHLGPAVRQRSGLVEDRRADPGHRLQRAAVLDQDPEPRRARHARDDRHRQRQDERARRRHHKHGERAQAVARQPPCGAGQQQGQEQEPDGVAIGDAHAGRLAVLRRLNQPHDVGVGALGGRPRRNQVEGVSDRGRAAQHLLSGRPADRHRLAGQRGLVEQRLAGRNAAVHRGDLAMPHQDAVAGKQAFDRNLFETPVGVAHGGAGDAAEQGRHLAPRPALCVALELLTAGIHQRHDIAGKRFVEGQRRRHGQRRHDVEPDFPVKQADRNFGEQRGKNRHGSRLPQPAGPIRLAVEMGSRSTGQPEQRDRDQGEPEADGEGGVLRVQLLSRKAG